MLSDEMNKAGTYLIGIIVVLAIIYVAISITHPPVPTTTPTTVTNVSFVPSGTLAVQLTDPPQVPNGTQSLVIGYSGLALHEAGQSNSTGFVDLNASGSVNLMNLTNFTQTIAVAHVKLNQSFDMVRFNITSAKIDINGTVYNVSVPNNRLQIKISGLNGTSGGALVDLSPTVLQIYAANQTIFLMVPAARAITINNRSINSTSVHIGFKARVNAVAKAKLEQVRPNITITGASLTSSGNSTYLAVIVKNNANSSVTLKQVMLLGYMRSIISANASLNLPDQQSSNFSSGKFSSNASSTSSISSTSTAPSTSTTYPYTNTGVPNYMKNLGLRNSSFNVSAIGAFTNAFNSSDISEAENILGTIANSPMAKALENEFRNRINASVIEDMHNINVSNVSLEAAIGEANRFSHDYHNALNFIVTSNGTLSLPFTQAEAEGPNGYVLGAGSSVTLIFNGTVAFGHDALANAHVNANQGVGPLIKLLANQTYTVRVIGEEGAYASMNVTAS